MKITDVTLTLFAWENIPATSYGRHTGKFGGQSQLGLSSRRYSPGPYSPRESIPAAWDREYLRLMASAR